MAAEGDYALGLMNNKGLDANVHSLLSDASFVFLRDGVSLKVVKDAGVKSPIVEFGPDGAFGTDVRDDEKAHAYMQQHGLEKGKFLCCIPNLRGAPYWRMKAGRKFDPKRHARNEEMKEQDHAPLREAIIAVVKETEMKILLCPEDSSHMEVNKELLYDPLPEDIKKRVVWRSEFWLTDEALSTYHASAGMFSADMHSPIMCIGNGIPAIHCRQMEKTSKGYMWKDIGLEDWLFDLDIAEDRARIPAAVLAMAKDPQAAKAKAEAAQKRVHAFQEHTIKVLKSSLA